MIEIEIKTEYIKLDSFMKWAGIVCQGTEAKILIQDGIVKVNDEVELRRGKKLYKGDIIEVEENTYKII